MDGKRSVALIIRRLKKEYPVLKPALNFSNPFELLVATILSAQTTDMHVNKVTEVLFKKYRSVQAFANADPDIFEHDVSSVNFYRNKARNIRKTASLVIENFNGKVPRTMEELITLPGVARKTANIILYNVYGINVGIAIDTHVIRLSRRLGWTENNDPVKIERDLMPLVPQEEWGNITHMLILHGRKVCQAKKPQHGVCILSDMCPSRDI
ncbi:MAG TPA: endonuclease III [Dissulfurispiraceae bacterium]|nr:endonuclease III [Dissulfurispiraceae bacterium]